MNEREGEREIKRERGRERERERQRESKRDDFRNVLGCISGTRWNWKARLVPSESASKCE